MFWGRGTSIFNTQLYSSVAHSFLHVPASVLTAMLERNCVEVGDMRIAHRGDRLLFPQKMSLSLFFIDYFSLNLVLKPVIYLTIVIFYSAIVVAQLGAKSRTEFPDRVAKYTSIDRDVFRLQYDGQWTTPNLYPCPLVSL